MSTRSAIPGRISARMPNSTAAIPRIKVAHQFTAVCMRAISADLLPSPKTFAPPGGEPTLHRTDAPRLMLAPLRVGVGPRVALDAARAVPARLLGRDVACQARVPGLREGHDAFDLWHTGLDGPFASPRERPKHTCGPSLRAAGRRAQALARTSGV